MRRAMLTLCCLILALRLPARSHILVDESYSSFNVGVKGGFVSSSLHPDRLEVDGNRISQYENNSQIGLYYSLLFRYNASHRLYFQTELTYAHISSMVSFDSNSWNGESQSVHTVSLAMKESVVEVPLLAGFNLIREGPYSMSLYTGLKSLFPLSDTRRRTFNGFGGSVIEEKPAEVYYCWDLGMVYRIGRMYICFSYDFGLNNISDGITVSDPVQGGAGNLNSLTMDRRLNKFSFAVGVMF